MKPIRFFLSIVAGIAVAIAVITAIQWVGHQAYPPPPDLTLETREAFAEFVASLPLGAFFFILASYVVGSFAGGALAARIAHPMGQRYSLIGASSIGVFLTIMGAINLVLIPHPLWFAIATMVTYLPMSYLGARLAGPARS